VQETLTRSEILALESVEQAGGVEIHAGDGCANGPGPSMVRAIG
jgi:hypothetical protein